jgi:predicted MFS family arabinose efflux permease
VAAVVGGFIPETRPDDVDDSGSGRLLAPSAVLPGSVMAASIWGLAMFSTFVPLYALRIGLSGSRFLFALHSIVVFTVRLFGARLPDRLGAPTAATGALACSIIGFIIMGSFESTTGLVAGTIIWSLGHSLAFPALMSMAIKGAPASERGAVVGTFTAFFDLAFGVGAMAAGGIVNATGYRGGFFSASIVAGAGLLLLQFRKRRKARGLATSAATL